MGDRLEKEVSSMAVSCPPLNISILQSLEELLYDTILGELESVMYAQPLLELVRFRAPEYIQQADIETITRNSTTNSEQISELASGLREREDGCYIFLDCLRQLYCSISDVKSQCPVTRHILWFVRDAEQAVSVVSCMRHSPRLQHLCQPFFWKLAHSHGFYYNCCNVFQHIDTSMIVIFPETLTDMATMKATIEGAFRKWRSPYLVVCSDLMGYEGQPLATPLLVTSSARLRDHVSELEASGNALWMIDELEELARETTLIHETTWLCYLLEKNGAEHDCDWLRELPWQRIATPPLTPTHKALLSSKLRHWQDKSLEQYMEDSRLWTPDASSILGWVPLPQLQRAVMYTTLTAPPTPPNNLVIAAGNVNVGDVRSDYVQAFNDIAMQHNIPSVIAVGVNASGCGLTTDTINKLATDNCAKLCIDCIVFHLTS